MFRREGMEGEETRRLPDGTLPKAGQLSGIRANTVLGQGGDPVVSRASLPASAPSDERDSERLLLFPGHLPPRAAVGSQA